MSNSPPKKLTVEYLRGSSAPLTVPFESGKKLTVVYGENAAGKSTICDAFEFLGSGKVGSLENRGLGRTNQYWPSVGRRPGEVSVTFETADSICKATIRGNTVVCSHPEHRPKVAVLRRADILTLVQATPANRYNAIKEFIDVSEVEASESLLRDTIRDMEQSLNTAATRLRENLDSIEQFWEEAGKPGRTALAWAVTESQRDVADLEKEAQALAGLRQTYQRLGEYAAELERDEQAVNLAIESLSKAQAGLQEQVRTSTASAESLVRLLESAKAHLDRNPNPLVCPLCESGEKAHELARRIDERLLALNSVRSAETIRHSRQGELEAAQQRLQTTRRSVRNQVERFAVAKTRDPLPEDIALPAAPVPDDYKGLSSWLQQNAPLVEAWNDAEATRSAGALFLRTLRRAVEAYEANVAAQQDIQDLMPNLQKALGIVEKERQSFTDAILAAIATEVGRLYEAVHPGEGLDKISIRLVPTRRASLDMGAQFLGVADVPPHAYFSDSHLDTLGLCVFLALSAKEGAGEVILVLDDILGSVDEPHVERLIEMLYREALKFRHCIMTTHYRPWKEKLRWGWLQNGQCQFLELARWTPQQGICLIHSVPDIERLRQLLCETPPDAQLVCAKAGVVLEACLDFLTRLYECRVPRRRSNSLALGDLLSAINAKLRDALTVDIRTDSSDPGESGYTTVKLAPALQELARIAQARNVFGAHFNAISFALLDADALGFGQEVLTLADALIDGAQGWPGNGKSGNYWANAGETRRLHPYAQPG